MSDSSTSFVPKLSSVPNAELKAKEVLAWLVQQDIVKATTSDCILGNPGYGYAISEGAKNVSAYPEDLPFDLITNGLGIITERTVFDTGEGFVDKVICPGCKEDIAYKEWNPGPWANNETDNLSCPLCKTSHPIHSFQFEPEWGFSNLGFTFWNWPEFKEEFIEEFKRVLAYDTAIVYQHI